MGNNDSDRPETPTRTTESPDQKTTPGLVDHLDQAQQNQIRGQEAQSTKDDHDKMVGNGTIQSVHVTDSAAGPENGTAENQPPQAPENETQHGKSKGYWSNAIDQWRQIIGNVTILQNIAIAVDDKTKENIERKAENALDQKMQDAGVPENIRTGVDATIHAAGIGDKAGNRFLQGGTKEVIKTAVDTAGGAASTYAESVDKSTELEKEYPVMPTILVAPIAIVDTGTKAVGNTLGTAEQFGEHLAEQSAKEGGPAKQAHKFYLDAVKSVQDTDERNIGDKAEQVGQQVTNAAGWILTGIGAMSAVKKTNELLSVLRANKEISIAKTLKLADAAGAAETHSSSQELSLSQNSLTSKEKEASTGKPGKVDSPAKPRDSHSPDVVLKSFELKDVDGKPLFSGKYETVGQALEAAAKSGADLKYVNLEHADLRGVNLDKINLTGANLRDAVLEDAHLEGTILTDARLDNANLRGTNLRDADLKYTILQGANLQDAHLEDAWLDKAVLTNSNMDRAHLNGANMWKTNLDESSLKGADLTNANAVGAHLFYAQLDGAVLNGANLNEADLRYANLIGANLKKANLNEANLSDANLTGANLIGATMEKTDLRHTNLCDADLTGVDLSETLDRSILETVVNDNTKIDLPTAGELDWRTSETMPEDYYAF